MENFKQNLRNFFKETGTGEEKYFLCLKSQKSKENH